jgi:thiosulfate dehydrogenase (quinone) large subunit
MREVANTDSSAATERRRWRHRSEVALPALARRVVVLRIGFGAVWAIDAYLKWQPSFVRDFLKTVSAGAMDQPHWLSPWFDFWRHVVRFDPHLFAYGSALVESVLAIGLLLGIGRRLLYVGGAAWSIMIWSVPEGFGTPFTPGATDIGTAIMYAILFATLYALESAASPTMLTLDSRVQRRHPRWAVVGQPGRRPLTHA